MFAVAFDLDLNALKANYPKTPTNAYNEIGGILKAKGFAWTQGSLYINDSEDLALLFSVLQDIKQLPWAKACVRDIRAFRVEQWSNFTPLL